VCHDESMTAGLAGQVVAARPTLGHLSATYRAGLFPCSVIVQWGECIGIGASKRWSIQCRLQLLSANWQLELDRESRLALTAARREQGHFCGAARCSMSVARQFALRPALRRSEGACGARDASAPAKEGFRECGMACRAALALLLALVASTIVQGGGLRDTASMTSRRTHETLGHTPGALRLRGAGRPRAPAAGASSAGAAASAASAADKRRELRLQRLARDRVLNMTEQALGAGGTQEEVESGSGMGGAEEEDEEKTEEEAQEVQEEQEETSTSFNSADTPGEHDEALFEAAEAHILFIIIINHIIL